MSVKQLSLLLTLSLILLATGAQAQSQNEILPESKQPSAVAVTAANTSPDAIRIASPGQILSIKLEIYNANGELVFDSGLRQGSVLDWKVVDASRTMADGSYLLATTIRDLQGKYRQRLGTLVLQSGQVSLKNQAPGEITAAQTQALNASRQLQKVEPADSDEAITILRDGKDRSLVITAHDG